MKNDKNLTPISESFQLNLIIKNAIFYLMNLFFKENLWSVFSYPIIRSTFNTLNGTLFSQLYGFGMMYSPCYVMDCDAHKVYLLNENWSFVSFKAFTFPRYMITVENSLYMSGDSNILKLDEILNTLIQYNATQSLVYCGLYFNSNNSLLYVA